MSKSDDIHLYLNFKYSVDAYTINLQKYGLKTVYDRYEAIIDNVTFKSTTVHIFGCVIVSNLKFANKVIDTREVNTLFYVSPLTTTGSIGNTISKIHTPMVINPFNQQLIISVIDASTGASDNNAILSFHMRLRPYVD